MKAHSKAREGFLFSIVSNNMENDPLIDIQDRLREAFKQRKEKIDIIRRYFPPSNGIVYLLLMRLSKERIIEMGEKYKSQKTYRVYDLTNELLSLNGYKNESAEFTLNDMQSLESHLNEYWRTELSKWTEIHLKAGANLENIADQLKEKKDISLSRTASKVHKTVKILKRLKKFEKFDRTKYNPEIFESATKRYKKATGFEKHYGRCLVAELIERGIASKGFETSEEFLNWERAYKWYRYKQKSFKVRSN